MHFFKTLTWKPYCTHCRRGLFTDFELTLKTPLGAQLYMDALHQSVPVPYKHTVLGDWLDTWDLAFNFSTHGIWQNYKSWSRGIPALTKGLVLKLENFFQGLEDLPLLWKLRCSVPHEPQEVSVKTKINVGYSQKLNRLRGEKYAIRFLRVLSSELPSTVCILESQRKLGTSPRIFQQQSVETWQRVRLLPQLPVPDPEAEPQRYELTLALSSSTMKWQREALKKYSLALYFSNGLSIVLAPTYIHPHHVRNVSIS